MDRTSNEVYPTSAVPLHAGDDRSATGYRQGEHPSPRAERVYDLS